MLISQPIPTTNSCRNYSDEPQTLSGWVALSETDEGLLLCG